MFRSSNMKKMNELSQVLSEYPEFSTSSSYVDAIKYTRQAFYNGDSSYYSLHPTLDLIKYPAELRLQN